MPTLTELTFFAYRVVAVGTLLLIIVRCALDFWRAGSGRGVIILKCLAALSIWLLISWGMTTVFFGEVAYAAGGPLGGAPDGAGLSNPKAVMILLFVIYTAACSSLSYWVLRGAEARPLS